MPLNFIRKSVFKATKNVELGRASEKDKKPTLLGSVVHSMVQISGPIDEARILVKFIMDGAVHEATFKGSRFNKAKNTAKTFYAESWKIRLPKVGEKIAIEVLDMDQILNVEKALF